MKISKEYILSELRHKTPTELAIEIVDKQMGSVPQGYAVQYEATVAKYAKMMEQLLLAEAKLT